MLDRLADVLRTLVQRGKVSQAVVGPRTLLQITGLNGQVAQSVELLLPPGYSARPVPGADILVMGVLGSQDHLVALAGDNANVDAIADLAPGEFGLRSGQQTIVMRTDHIEVNTNTYVKMTAAQYVEIDTPLLKISGDVQDNFASNAHTVANMRTIFNAHANTGVTTGAGTSGPPSTTM